MINKLCKAAKTQQLLSNSWALICRKKAFIHNHQSVQDKIYRRNLPVGTGRRAFLDNENSLVIYNLSIISGG